MKTLALIAALLLPALAIAQPVPTCGNPSGTCKASKFTLLAGHQLCLNSATCSTTLKADATTAGMVLNSGVANSGTNAAYTFDTTAALSGSTALFSIKKAGTEFVRVTQGGNISLLSGAQLCLDASCTISLGESGSTVSVTATSGVGAAYFIATTEVRAPAFYNQNQSLPPTLRNQAADSGTNVGAIVTSDAAWTLPGAKMFSFRNNSVEKAFVGLNGDLVAQSTLISKRTFYWYPATTAATAFTGVGTINGPPSPSGTPTAAPTADSTMMMVKYASGAVSGNVAGWLGGAGALTRFNYKPRITITFRTDSTIATQRVFIGISNSDPSGAATLAALNTAFIAAIRFDTGLADANWMAVTSDGATASATSTGIAVAINTTYTVTIDLSIAGHAAFTINGTQVVDKTTNIPTGTNDLGPVASLTTLTTAAENLYVGKIQLDQN